MQLGGKRLPNKLPTGNAELWCVHLHRRGDALVAALKRTRDDVEPGNDADADHSRNQAVLDRGCSALVTQKVHYRSFLHFWSIEGGASAGLAVRWDRGD